MNFQTIILKLQKISIKNYYHLHCILNLLDIFVANNRIMRLFHIIFFPSYIYNPVVDGCAILTPKRLYQTALSF